jgi:large subunit ribosomal protein L3
MNKILISESKEKAMLLKLMGKKRGMTQLFDEKGNAIVCTIIETEPHVIAQVKTKEIDGYDAIQLGFEKIKTKDPRTVEKRVSKPLLGHFKKASLEPRRHIFEARLEAPGDFTVGQELNVDIFDEVPFVDATAISKGKGYQGVMKLYNYSGGPASHGSGFHRHAGSTGMRSTPGRCLPGGKRASHMGLDRKTVQNLRVVMIDKEDNLIIVEGSIPGPKNGLVTISAAVKKRKTSKKSHK